MSDIENAREAALAELRHTLAVAELEAQTAEARARTFNAQANTVEARARLVAARQMVERRRTAQPSD